MSAATNRRGLLALFAAAPVAAAAAGTAPPARALGRLLPGFAGGTLRPDMIGAAMERAIPLEPDAPTRLIGLAAALQDVHRAAGTRGFEAAQARAIAALALAFPAEIAAYRSFGVPMRRQLYAELLTRESARLATAGEPSPTPPASPGPDA